MNNKTKATITAAAATAAIAAGVALAPAASATGNCPGDKEMYYGQCWDPSQVTKTTAPQSGGRPTVGDLMFRDHNAVPTGSGMYANATFRTTGNAIKVNDVEYIEVIQDQFPGTQGYGRLYKGYVTKQYTRLDG